MFKITDGFCHKDTETLSFTKRYFIILLIPFLINGTLKLIK